MKRTTVAFFDLDNTLYDWLGFFGPAMRGLCVRISELSGCDVPTLYEDFKRVFTQRGSVEYHLALQELNCLRDSSRQTTSSVLDRYSEAIQIYRSRRRQYLQLYPGVCEGLADIKSLGIKVVAVSDAHKSHVQDRLQQLGIESLFDALCCVSDFAGVTRLEKIHQRRVSTAAGRRGRRLRPEVFVTPGIRKPDPRVLTWLASELGARLDECVYVGDSLVKDISMAQTAGVYDCWAAYGAEYSPADMATLIRVTNWPPSAVQNAISASPESLGVFPSSVARSFTDVVQVVTCAPDERPIGIGRQPELRQLPLFELSSIGVTSEYKNGKYVNGRQTEQH